MSVIPRVEFGLFFRALRKDRHLVVEVEYEVLDGYLIVTLYLRSGAIVSYAITDRLICDYDDIRY